MARTAARIYLPLDVAFLDDDKVIAAGERAAWLYVAILLRIKHLDTDGIITRAQIARTGVTGWQTRLGKLIAVGLVVTDDADTFVIPAWSKWNELSHQRAERHRKDRERKAASKDSIPRGIQRHSALNAVQSSEGKPRNPPQPPPVRDVLRRINTPDTAG